MHNSDIYVGMPVTITEPLIAEELTGSDQEPVIGIVIDIEDDSISNYSFILVEYSSLSPLKDKDVWVEEEYVDTWDVEPVEAIWQE